MKLNLSVLKSINDPDWNNPFENELSSTQKSTIVQMNSHRKKLKSEINIRLTEVLPVLNDFNCRTNVSTLRTFLISKEIQFNPAEFSESNCPQNPAAEFSPGVVWVMPNIQELKIRTASRLTILYPQLQGTFSEFISDASLKYEKQKFVLERQLLIPTSIERFELRNDQQFMEELSQIQSFRNLTQQQASRLIRKSFIENKISGRLPGKVGCESSSLTKESSQSLTSEEIVATNSCLPEPERLSIDNYFGIGYSSINSALRRMDLTFEITQKVNLIKSALRRLVPYQGVVFRGAGESSLFDRIVPGEESFMDPAFLSTSLDSDVAQKFTERNIAPARFILLSKTCRYISHINGLYGSGENEVLCAAGTSFDVLHKVKIDQVTYFLMEEK